MLLFWYDDCFFVLKKNFLYVIIKVTVRIRKMIRRGAYVLY